MTKKYCISYMTSKEDIKHGDKYENYQKESCMRELGLKYVQDNVQIREEYQYRHIMSGTYAIYAVKQRIPGFEFVGKITTLLLE